MKLASIALILFLSIPTQSIAETLSSQNYADRNDTHGVVIVAANWGRDWQCASFDNAQLIKLRFERMPLTSEPDAFDIIELNSPSKLFVKSRFNAFAHIVAPGKYGLVEYSVRAAKSMTDVGYFDADKATLIEQSEPKAGYFTVNAGEIVYVGHFGIDCYYEPIPWRFHPQAKADYKDYVKSLKIEFPQIKNKDIVFRLFKTSVLGNDFSLD